MKTRNLLIISAFVSMAFFIGSCHKSSYNNDNTANKVSILSTVFSPASIIITSGATVNWTNKDTAMHTVTTPDGSISSGDIAAGSSFTQTFGTAGTFNYYDTHNTAMTGVLIVTKSSGSGY